MTEQRSPLLDGLRVAMLGTTDGDFIEGDSEVPAGEMYRLAADYMQGILDAQDDVKTLQYAQGLLRAPTEPLTDIESLVPDLVNALHSSVMRNYEYTRQTPRDDPEAGKLATLLLETWQKNDPKSGVAKYPASYMETFLDMARAVIDSRKYTDSR